MKIMQYLHLLVVGAVAISCEASEAGDCNCHRTASGVAVSKWGYQRLSEFDPVSVDACGCSAAAPASCGLGGLIGIGSMYSHHVAAGRSIEGGYEFGSHGEPNPGSFVSGFENLPNMDGGGVHYRYPYHSYRRPWAFPGTPSTNVTIVW